MAQGLSISTRKFSFIVVFTLFLFTLQILVVFEIWKQQKQKGGIRNKILMKLFFLQVFNRRMPTEAMDLVSRLLQYSPILRFTAVSDSLKNKRMICGSGNNINAWISFSFLSHQLEACAHPFFDDLRAPNAYLPNGRPLPPLFNFSPEGECIYVFATQLFLSSVLFQPLSRCCSFSQNWPVHHASCYSDSFQNIPGSKLPELVVLYVPLSFAMAR